MRIMIVLSLSEPYRNLLEPYPTLNDKIGINDKIGFILSLEVLTLILFNDHIMFFITAKIITEIFLLLYKKRVIFNFLK